jgi:hypothetical protein
MKTLFLTYLVVEALFGLGFLFLPALLMGPMGVTLDETSINLARMFGSLIISIPFLLYFAHKSTNLEFKKGVIYCALVYLAASTIVLLIAQLKGMMNSLGWSIVFLHFAFFIWFGYHAIALGKSPSPQRS